MSQGVYQNPEAQAIIRNHYNTLRAGACKKVVEMTLNDIDNWLGQLTGHIDDMLSIFSSAPSHDAALQHYRQRILASMRVFRDKVVAAAAEQRVFTQNLRSNAPQQDGLKACEQQYAMPDEYLNAIDSLVAYSLSSRS